MLFKRFSRSRSNSQSYVDNNYSPQDSKTQGYDDGGARYPPGSNERYGGSAPVSAGSNEILQDDRRDLPSSRHSNTAPSFSGQGASETRDMYPSQSRPSERDLGSGGADYGSPMMDDTRITTNGYGTSGSGGAVRDSGYTSGAPAAYEPKTSSSRTDQAPSDLLMQAFNAALRPHMDKVDGLENEIQDLRAYVQQLEQQQSDVHQWIDKRGLRPDVPPNIAAQMDASSTQTQGPTHAAATLNAQLDRKITIVNFDLHRLQDDLNDSLPTPSFSACMLKFLPDISRLSALQSGPKYAFDLLLKLGGNLNSHGGLENGDEEDLAERRAFYGRLDEAMVDVVRGRFKEEGDQWGVQKEIKRIEKTGAYLRNWGVEPYFPRTLDVMKSESGISSGGVGGSGTPPTY